jgi:hypothetical protein
MVNHPCPKCGENFNKKSTYLNHLKRKKPCEKKTPNIAPITPDIAPITPEKQYNNEFCVEIRQPKVNIKTNINQNELKNDNGDDSNDDSDDNKLCCKFCKRQFSRKFCLDRHLNGRCKDDIKTQQNNNINKKLIENENKMNLILKQNEELILKQSEIEKLILKQNEELILKQNEIEKLKSEFKKTKKVKRSINKTTNNTTNNTNNTNNTTNNININQPILINFNNLNYNDMDKKLFIQPIMNARLFGKAIILQMIENIYINESHPEYHNLIVTDKNRGYVKIYNNGKWKTDNINIINMVIDGIITHSKTILIELKDQYVNNNNAKNRLNASEKYINLCDLEYLNDLEDEQENDEVDNKKQIKRCKEFREMVYKDTVNLFHDNKNLLLKSKDNKAIEPED